MYESEFVIVEFGRMNSSICTGDNGL